MKAIASVLGGVLMLPLMVGGHNTTSHTTGSIAGKCETVTKPTTAPPALKTARVDGVQYYLSLPIGWTPDRTWPVVVTVDGSGGDHVGNCGYFSDARQDRPYIIVTPCVNSDGHDPADHIAVMAIAQEVIQEYHGEPKYYLTGFSSGAHDLWQVVFEHPEVLAGACGGSGIFIGRGIETVSTAPERVRLPIHDFVGQYDMSGIAAQVPRLIAFGAEHGYTDITGSTIPNRGHSADPDEVLAYFDSLRGVPPHSNAGRGFNLSKLGTIDWAHWNGTYIHKTGGGSKISDVVQIGGGAYGSWQSSWRNVNWSDGAPAATSIDDQNYIWCNGTTGQGWRFTVPADATPRTVCILCGASTTAKSMKLTAHLSDGSAGDFADTQTSTPTANTYLYTITYDAAKPGQTLAITLTNNDADSKESTDLDAVWLR